MSKSERMSLKEFWEAVEHKLAKYSTDELRAMLRAMAQATSPTERQSFLDKLNPAKGTTVLAQKKLQSDELLAEIDDLGQEIQDAMAGTDHMEEGYDHWDDYSDEESDSGPYEELLEPLTALFDRVQAVFEYGDFSLARNAYRKLFEETLQFQDDYGRGLPVEDLTGVEVGESLARYLRAVYETARPKKRSATLWEAMLQTRTWVSRPRLMLNDLIQITPAPLPDQDGFFADWIALLRKQKGEVADIWLREAIRLAHGTPGLEELALTDGREHPRAYLDWFTALKAESQYREVVAAAQTALQTLPGKLPIRAAIADYLCDAAAQLKEFEALRRGRWEAFNVAPTLPRLLDLWDAAPNGDAQTQWMRQSAGHIRTYLAQPPYLGDTFLPLTEDHLESPVRINETVLVQACLLAGDLDSAHEWAAREKVLGWSNSANSQGFVVPFFLILLSGKTLNLLPLNLKQIWQRGLETSANGGYWHESNNANTRPRLERLYANYMPQLTLSQSKQTVLLGWCLEVATKRMEAIVGNQHRGSYDKAAVLIGACTEVLRLRGDHQAADALLSEVRERFPRHRAFLAELDTATGRAKSSRR